MKMFYENYFGNDNLFFEKININEFRKIIANSIIYLIFEEKIADDKIKNEKYENYKYLVNIFYLLCCEPNDYLEEQNVKQENYKEEDNNIINESDDS